jgi:hypothetical protein
LPGSNAARTRTQSRSRDRIGWQENPSQAYERKHSTRWLWITLTLDLLTGIALLAWVRWEIKNRVIITNESGQTIAELSVKVCGQTIDLKNIALGDSVSAQFDIHTDDHFTLNGRLEDGTKLVGELGYVTNGDFGQRVRLVIRARGVVEFSQDSRF